MGAKSTTTLPLVFLRQRLAAGMVIGVGLALERPATLAHQEKNKE